MLEGIVFNSKFKHSLVALYCLLAFLLLYFVQINIPMQSDDYRYLSLGGDFSALVNHYLGWSGRLAADVTSSTILSVFPKEIYSALNSLALVVLLLLCTKLPALILNEKMMTRDYTTFLVLFLTYWISNTNLGQTTFWIVGSANYLWTNLYIVIFFCIFSFLTSRDIKAIYIPVVFLCGFVGGVTNENTGWITFSFVLFCYLHHRFDKDIRLIRGVYASGFLGGLLGWLTLILAPGNSIRAKYFQGWYSLDVDQRVDIHLYDRLPNFLGNYTFVFIFIILIFAMQMAISSSTNIKSSCEKNSRRIRENSSRRLFLFFIACGLLSMLMMVGSPGIAPRAGNGTLIFFLMALSSLIYTCNSTSAKSSVNVIQYVVILSFAVIYFIPSYYLVHFSSQRTAYQEKFRNDLVSLAVKTGVDSVSIPDFYFSRLLKNSDKFDLYHNGHEMAKFHGGKLKNIAKYNAGFDFSAITKNNGEIQIERNIFSDLILHKVIFYSEPGRPFFKKRDFILFEFNELPTAILTDKNKRIFFHIKNNKTSFINADIGRPAAVKVGSKYYFSRQLPDGALNNEIKAIEFGVFDHVGRDSTTSIKF